MRESRGALPCTPLTERCVNTYNATLPSVQVTVNLIIHISETTACWKFLSEIIKTKPYFSMKRQPDFLKNLVNVEDRFVFAFRCACIDLIKSFTIPFR